VETEIFGHKITNKIATFFLSVFGVTLCWMIVAINPIIKLFGKSLIGKEKIVNDYRCELCKKEASKN
jgi:hypothetical protein